MVPAEAIADPVRSDPFDLYYEEMGEGVPILLIHPSGATASTWGSAADELARIGRVIAYDRRGYARSGGEPVHSMSAHTADAAALLEHLQTPPAVVVGTSAGAAIAVDLAVRRPDLVRVVIAHEFPWRFTRHLPTRTQIAALAKTQHHIKKTEIGPSVGDGVVLAADRANANASERKDPGFDRGLADDLDDRAHIDPRIEIG